MSLNLRRKWISKKILILQMHLKLILNNENQKNLQYFDDNFSEFLNKDGDTVSHVTFLKL